MITTATQHCWTVRPTDGAELDYEPHFESEQQAKNAIEQTSDHHGVGAERLEIARQPTPCSTAQCDTCEYQYDENEEGIEHWPSAADLADTLTDAGWRIADRETWCPECARDLPPDDDQRFNPAMPGQLDLAGQEIAATP